jgi:hypothetical protein
MDPRKWEELDAAIDDFKDAIAKGEEGRVVTERAELLATAATAALEDHDADQLAGHEGRENGPPGARPSPICALCGAPFMTVAGRIVMLHGREQLVHVDCWANREDASTFRCEGCGATFHHPGSEEDCFSARGPDGALVCEHLAAAQWRNITVRVESLPERIGRKALFIRGGWLCPSCAERYF